MGEIRARYFDSLELIDDLMRENKHLKNMLEDMNKLENERNFYRRLYYNTTRDKFKKERLNVYTNSRIDKESNQ